MSEIKAYPLQWPDGWRRHGATKYGGVFKRHNGPITFDYARRLLFDELQRLGVRDAILSTNLRTRGDGMVYADEARRSVDDPGVALYFKFRDRPMVIAQDVYDTVQANVRSIGLAIEAIRQMQRHGGSSMMERAFTGFTALPRPKTCWEILGIPATKDAQAIRTAHKGLIIDNQHSPAGSDERAAIINAARDDALREAAR